MKPESQRIAIAEACGFEDVHTGVHPTNQWKNFRLGLKTGKELHEPVPDYLTDLNAMHQAEKLLEDEQWRDYIIHIHFAWSKHQMNHVPSAMKKNVGAPAKHRAEAFLRTLNLWDDTK